MGQHPYDPDFSLQQVVAFGHLALPPGHTISALDDRVGGELIFTCGC